MTIKVNVKNILEVGTEKKFISKMEHTRNTREHLYTLSQKVSNILYRSNK